jgi:hypothetical protein
MPIETRFRPGHVVKRMAPVLDGNGQPTEDAFGHKVVAEVTVATLLGLIQPLTERELALQSQAGATISTHHIFFLPNALVTAACWVEYEGARYDIDGLEDVGGAGRLLQVSARKVS